MISLTLAGRKTVRKFILSLGCMPSHLTVRPYVIPYYSYGPLDAGYEAREALAPLLLFLLHGSYYNGF